MNNKRIYSSFSVQNFAKYNRCSNYNAKQPPRLTLSIAGGVMYLRGEINGSRHNRNGRDGLRRNRNRSHRHNHHHNHRGNRNHSYALERDLRV